MSARAAAALRHQITPLRPTERALARLWRSAHLLPEGLVAQDGRRFQVVYPGRPSARAGPDFRDSVLEIEGGRLLVGDVELHVEARDWAAHGHHRDPNYNGVLLHVVLRVGGVGSSRQQSKMEAPVVSLAAVAALLDRAASSGPSPPAGLRHLDAPALEELLDRAGDLRFLARSRGFAVELGWIDAEQALYAALMEGLGYASNRKPFRALARALPIATLAALRGEPAATRLLAIKAMLLGAARLMELEPADERRRLEELLRHLPKTRKIPAACWSTFRVRPANHPARRVAGAALLVDRHAESGLARGLEQAVRQGEPRWVVQALAVPPLIGATRAREMAVNAVLPFVHAWAGIRRDAVLRDRCLDLYRRFPGLPDNEITREARRVLAPQIQASAVRGARRHQGLIYLYKNMKGLLSIPRDPASSLPSRE